jgi:rubrerythrin
MTRARRHHVMYMGDLVTEFECAVCHVDFDYDDVSPFFFARAAEQYWPWACPNCGAIAAIKFHNL